jgi:hypothetical protein
LGTNFGTTTAPSPTLPVTIPNGGHQDFSLVFTPTALATEEESFTSDRKLGDETLRTIAQELVRSVRNSVTIDWTVRENVRAQMRVIIKRILRKYGYPPDKQARATELVLEQAEVLCRDWFRHGTMIKSSRRESPSPMPRTTSHEVAK